MLVAFKSWGYMQESPEQKSQWLSSAWTGGYLDYLGWKQRNGLYVEVGTDVCRPYRTNLKRCRKRKSLGKENQRILGKVDKIEHLPDISLNAAWLWWRCPRDKLVTLAQGPKYLYISHPGYPEQPAWNWPPPGEHKQDGWQAEGLEAVYEDQTW